MPGTRSRRKGKAGEREWAKFTDGKVVSRIGQGSPDVETPPLCVVGLRLWETKRLEELPIWLQEWQEQTIAEGADGLAFRQDRGEWWVLIPAARLSRGSATGAAGGIPPSSSARNGAGSNG